MKKITIRDFWAVQIALTLTSTILAVTYNLILIYENTGNLAFDIITFMKAFILLFIVQDAFYIFIIVFIRPVVLLVQHIIKGKKNKFYKKIEYNPKTYIPEIPKYPVAINVALSNDRILLLHPNAIKATYFDIKNSKPVNLMKHQQYVMNNYDKLISLDIENLFEFERFVKQDLEEQNLYKESSVERIYYNWFAPSAVYSTTADTIRSVLRFIISSILLIFIICTSFLGIIPIFILYKLYKLKINHSYTEKGKKIYLKMIRNMLYFEENVENPEVLNNKEYAPYLIILGIKQLEKWKKI